MKPKIKYHTPKERMALKRHKRKFGPAAMRRKERRLPLQWIKSDQTELEALGVKDGE